VNILLNFVPLKSGGGMQVGLDFVRQAKVHGSAHRWYLVATAGTPLSRVEPQSNFFVAHLVPRNALARLWFEVFGCIRVTRRVRPAVIYTQFGPQWPGARRFVNVVGCAYSNLVYPEIDFWGRLDLPRRWLRKMIDILRERRVRQADVVVFETADLAERGVRLLGLDSDRVHVVQPSISSLVAPDVLHEETRKRCEQIPCGFRVLLLAAYNPNKNIELLPRVAQALANEHGDHDVLFLTTLPGDAAVTRNITDMARDLGVASRVHNVGPVPQEGCAELYRCCDAVILPSQLESFSNTIAEAWTMQRPLLVSDLAWARALCGDGALYFRYDDAGEAARQIHAIKTDARLRQDVVHRGTRMLATYPTAEQRFRRYLDIIERYAER